MNTVLQIICIIVLLEIGILIGWSLRKKMRLEIKTTLKEIEKLFKKKDD